MKTCKKDIKSRFFSRIHLFIRSTGLGISAGILLISSLQAQDKTQYLLYEIPQTISLNPAVSYYCKNYIELPVISQIQAYYRNNGFAYNQAFEGGTGISRDSIRIDIDGLSRALVNRNHIRIGGRINLMGFGFAYQDWYFSFNISNRSAFRLSFNRDIIDARDGNWDVSANLPRDIDINGTGLHLLNYTEIAFGASYALYPGLSVGIRPKYLIGSAHLQTRKSNISLVTSESPITLTGYSDLLVRGSLPVTVEENSQGRVTEVRSNLNSLADLPSFLMAWNHGFAIDAGIIYDYTDRLKVSASVLDLGFIRWRNNTNSISQQEDFVFEGVDLNNYLQTGTDIDFLQALRDSISDNFSLAGSEDAYFAMIPLRLMAGADYEWNDEIRVGAVFESEILSGRIYPSLSLTVISRPAEWLTASMSYSLMDRGFSNIGFGLVLGNRALQFYFITDNLPLNYVKELESGLFLPYRARTMNVRTGINKLFGCRNEHRGTLWKYYRSLKWRKSCPAYD